MTDGPPPLDPGSPIESPRWIVADGLLEVPTPYAPILRREAESLREAVGLRVSVSVENGRASALLDAEPLEVPEAGSSTPDPARAAEALEMALKAIWDEVRNLEHISSSWRLSEFGTRTVTETVFAVTEEGPQIIGRPRPLTADDAEKLIRSPRSSDPLRFLGKLAIWQRALVAAALIVAIALIFWTSPFAHRWFAPNTLEIEGGPLRQHFAITLESKGTHYEVTLLRAPSFPDDVDALRRLETKARTPEELAAWRALAGRRDFKVVLRDGEGRRLRSAPIALPQLLDRRENSVKARLPKDRRAATLTLNHH
jgi:hypothetical protein